MILAILFIFAAIGAIKADNLGVALLFSILAWASVSSHEYDEKHSWTAPRVHMTSELLGLGTALRKADDVTPQSLMDWTSPGGLINVGPQEDKNIWPEEQ